MKNSRKCLSLFAAVVLITLILSADSTARGQELGEWTVPVNVGASVNTPGFDGCPFVTSDGLDLLFMSNFGSNAFELYVAHRETVDSAWGMPASLGADVNTADFNEACPSLSADGQFLYFVSNRPGGCGDFDIYVSRRLDMASFTEWSSPRNLGCHVNGPGPDLSPSLFEPEEGTAFLYYSSGLRPKGLGFGDIYVSLGQSDGTFGPARDVSEFNTQFNEIRPKIRARDGLEIFFDSNQPFTRGAQDLYSSTRACALCRWAAPKNLGRSVNSPAIDGGPALSIDGAELYFMSNRPGGFGDQDIYVSSRRIIFDSQP